MATAKTTADDWIKAGLRALASGGPAAIKIETIAATLKVTKGGFYWHFANRQEFLNRMLDTWERSVIEDVIAYLDARPTSPRERLHKLYELAQASTAVSEGLGAELAIREWARHDPAVAERLRSLDNRRMAYMRDLFTTFARDHTDAEARSFQLASLLIGNFFIAAEHDGLTRDQVIAAAVETLLQ